MKLEEKIQQIEPYSALLKSNTMGIEKEGLRVSRKGGLSQAPHPKAFGCALTHPNITTDFSESLIELVTPPLVGADTTLDYLAKTQQYLYHHLPKDQSFWHSSMPCVIRGETYIPIAQYGSSNRGKMKTVYRQGLANRYGSVMQTIAGIHFNYSFSQQFWQAYQHSFASNVDIKRFVNRQYMALTRNVVRYGWIIPYLFGASPAVCKSFLKGYHEHSLEEFNETTLFEPYATSLRMGDIGYQNLREDEAGVKANYNSLNHYVHSLESAIQTSSPLYESIGVKKAGEYQQLNTNILQIENEYYASVRPKPPINANLRPLNALVKNGIDYIEIRSIDINPLTPLGIDQAQIHFLESFLLFCLLHDSALISTSEQFEIDTNDHVVAHKGRQPGIELIRQSSKVLLKDWGLELGEEIIKCAKLFGKKHQSDVEQIIRRFDSPDLTPSAVIISEMENRNQGFFDYTNSCSKKYRREFLSLPTDQQHFNFLDQQAKLSCEKQQRIEQADTLSFDDYLEQYFHE